MQTRLPLSVALVVLLLVAGVFLYLLHAVTGGMDMPERPTIVVPGE